MENREAKPPSFTFPKRNQNIFLTDSLRYHNTLHLPDSGYVEFDNNDDFKAPNFRIFRKASQKLQFSILAFLGLDRGFSKRSSRQTFQLHSQP